MKLIEKLDWKEGALELMEYIGIIESIYIPDLDEYDYGLNVECTQASTESIQEANFLPFGATGCMQIFYKRYNDGIFKERFSYDKFINNEVIKSLVQSLKLDTEKFWLLILFIYDYCNSMFYEGTTMKDNPLEQLHKLVDAINTSDTGKLTYQFGKRKVEIDDPHALSFIAESIIKQIKESDIDKAKYLSRRIEVAEASMLKDSPIIAYFAKMFLVFFDTQEQVRNLRKKGANHSIKERDLICQLIYFTRLSTKECWLMEENETLKPFLKQYKDYKYPHNVSNIYPEFSV